MGVSNFDAIDVTGTITQATAVSGTITATIADITTANITTANITTSNITTEDIVNLNLGTSGTAGNLDIFPTTAAKGKLTFVATDSTGDTTTTITNAAQAGAVTYTIPDAGASANFVMSQGAATIAGAKTLSSVLTITPTTNQLVLGVTNTTTISSTAPSASRVYTIADAGANGNILISNGIGGSLVSRTSAAVTKNANTTYANVTGLSATVQVGTYKFRAVLPSTVASGTGGIKYAFNYTTTVLSALEATGIGYTAAAVAVQHTTTTTTQTDLFTQAEVVIMTVLEGTFTASTGGTIDVQMAQNTSNASDTVALVGGSFEVNRIA